MPNHRNPNRNRNRNRIAVMLSRLGGRGYRVGEALGGFGGSEEKADFDFDCDFDLDGEK